MGAAAGAPVGNMPRVASPNPLAAPAYSSSGEEDRAMSWASPAWEAPFLSTPLPSMHPLAKAAAGQRPFPTSPAAAPVTGWRPEPAWKDRKLGGVALVPLPALCLGTGLRDFWHSTAQLRRVPTGLIHKTSCIQATAYSPGSYPRGTPLPTCLSSLLAPP